MLKEGEAKMAIKTPLYYKFRRLDNLRGFRYPLPQFLTAVRQFPGDQHRFMRQANLIDVLVRKVFSLNLVELREHLVLLRVNGGFLRAEDFVYVMSYLKKLTSHYAYYKEAPFKNREESWGYATLVSFYAQEFTQKFHYDPAAMAQATDFVTKSLPFWLEHMNRFSDAELLQVGMAIAQLSRKVDLPQKSDFTAKLLPRIESLMKKEKSAALHALQEMDLTFQVLTPNQRDALKQKLEDLTPSGKAPTRPSTGRKNSSRSASAQSTKNDSAAPPKSA